MNGSTDHFVGAVALVLLPMIALRIIRGVRDGRLPIYRTTLTRADNAGKFNLVLAFHIASFLVVGFIAADLLFDLRDAS
ncbi:MAG TPA: hypothetical protein VGC35_12370 [Allosphingosinicella sp.]|jgi:hypothetical protein